MNKLEQEIAEAQKKLELQNKLKAKYPDLDINVNRWKTERYVATVVPDKLNTYHSCGCCDDASLIGWPYKQDEEFGVAIYAKDMMYSPAEKSWGMGYCFDSGWEEVARKKGWPESLINKMAEKQEEQDEEDDE
jgi:hypothetical protein